MVFLVSLLRVVCANHCDLLYHLSFFFFSFLWFYFHLTKKSELINYFVYFIGKPKEGHSLSFNQVTVTHPNSVPLTKSRKIQSTKSLETHNWYPMKGSKLTLEPKNMKKKPVGQMKAYIDMGSQNIIKSQGADGSGITSAKDNTSARTSLSEKLREPLPCQGRKELISLAQEAMQNPNHESSRGPASKRKRVAAPPGEEEKVDKKFVYISPMPLHAAGIAVAGAGLLKNKGILPK